MQPIIANPRASLCAGRRARRWRCSSSGWRRPAPTASASSPSWCASCTCWPPWSGSASSCFVNFVQLVALQSTDEPGPRVPAQGHRAQRRLVVPACLDADGRVSGALLLVTTGYLLPTLVYGAGVYVPPSRAWLIGAGVLGGLAMWMFVHMYIWPNMQVVLGLRPGDADAKARARARVVTVRQAQSHSRRAGHARHGGGGAPLLTWPSSAQPSPIRGCRRHCCCRARRRARPLPRRAAGPAAGARRPAGAGGVLGRDRPRALRRRAASRPSARSACSGGAMRWSRGSAARAHRQPRSPMRCAPRPSATTSPARSCSDMIDARSLDVCRRGAGRRRGSARLICGKARARCSPGRAHPGARRPGADVGRGRGGVRPRLRSGAAAARPAAGPVAAGSCRCRSRASRPPG